MYTTNSAMSQGIKHPLGVSTFGSSFTRVAPDFASVDFRVDYVAVEASVALEAARTGAQEMLETLMSLGVAADDISLSDIELEQKFEGSGQNRKVVGYACETSFDLIARKIDSLDRLLVEIVRLAGSREIYLSNISFHSARLMELRVEARTRAVHAAREKAEVLASAAGRKVGRAIHLEDVNPSSLSDDGHQTETNVIGLEDEAGHKSPFGPRSITVAAAVMAAFSFED